MLQSTASFIYAKRKGLEESNAARTSAAGEGWTEPILYFLPALRRKKMQTNLAGSDSSKIRSAAIFNKKPKKNTPKPYGLGDSLFTLCFPFLDAGVTVLIQVGNALGRGHNIHKIGHLAKLDIVCVLHKEPDIFQQFPVKQDRPSTLK